MSKANRKKPERRWRNPSTIAPHDVELEIIKAVESIRSQMRWTRPDAIAFARCALKVALKEAIKWQGKRSRDQLDYWEASADLSAQASAAIKLLVRHIEPDGLKNGIEMHGYGTIRARHTLRKMPNGNLATRENTRAELALLVDAYETTMAINRTAKQYRALLGKPVGNEREHDKHAFVYRLAEAWIYLTGKLPGSGRDRNPFLRFVEAAGIDAGIDDEDFFSATKQAIDILRGLEDLMRGATNNREAISGIRTNGPQWLK
jgi:hypothetical protein